MILDDPWKVFGPDHLKQQRDLFEKMTETDGVDLRFLPLRSYPAVVLPLPSTEPQPGLDARPAQG